MSDSINLTDVLTLIIHDIIKSTDEFKSYDINKILVCCASNRRDSKGAIYGKLQPLRFKGGSEIIKHNERHYAVPKVVLNNIEMLYVLYLYFPKFFNLTARDKINVLFHELYHISPEFNGDIRRMSNFKYAHGHSKEFFEAQYIEYASEYFNKINETSFYNFLQMNLEDIKKQFKVIKYSRMKTIKPQLVSSVSSNPAK